MKTKLIIASLAILTFVSTSCKKEKEEPTNGNQNNGSATEYVMYRDDAKAIEGTWKSSDDYVAQIVGDSVKARHIGTCKITKDNDLAYITVIPRYNFFAEPITNFGIDTTALITQINQRPFPIFSKRDENRALLAFINKNILPIEADLYYFENNKLTLTWSLIPQNDLVRTSMSDFLKERYEYMETTTEQTIWSDASVDRYMDAYSLNDATKIVGSHTMVLDDSFSEFMQGIGQPFGTNTLQGLIYQEASLTKFDTLWVQSYVEYLQNIGSQFGAQ